MSARICYLAQDPRSGKIRSLRLVNERLGGSADQAWAARPDEGGELATQVSDAAAGWLAERLAAAGGSTPAELSLLCIDVEGSLCSWLSTPSSDIKTVETLARQAPAADTDAGSAPLTPLAHFAQSPLDASVQPLGLEVAADVKPAKRGVVAPNKRIPVLVAADAPARLLLDAIDARGVRVLRVASLWQAMAAAWDPPPAGEAAALTNANTVATVMVDPVGRIVWTWSISGALLAAGTQRVPMVRADSGADVPSPTQDQAARLCAEWLSWSAQLGSGPTRVAVIAPEDAPACAAFGEALAKLWKGATVDFVTAPDPLLATLKRVAASVEVGSGVARTSADSLSALEDRPGSLHRSSHVWVAAGVGALAIALFALSFRLSRDASSSDSAAASYREQWTKMVEKAVPGAMNSMDGPLLALQDEVEKKEKDFKPPDRVDLALPVMQELETLSMVLGSGEIQLDELDLDSAQNVVRLRVTVPSTERAEEIREALRAIGGSNIAAWGEPNYPSNAQPGQKLSVTYVGTWSDNVRKKSAAGGSGGGAR